MMKMTPWFQVRSIIFFKVYHLVFPWLDEKIIVGENHCLYTNNEEKRFFSCSYWMSLVFQHSFHSFKKYNCSFPITFFTFAFFCVIHKRFSFCLLQVCYLFEKMFRIVSKAKEFCYHMLPKPNVSNSKVIVSYSLKKVPKRHIIHNLTISKSVVED